MGSVISCCFGGDRQRRLRAPAAAAQGQQLTNGTLNQANPLALLLTRPSIEAAENKGNLLAGLTPESVGGTTSAHGTATVDSYAQRVSDPMLETAGDIFSSESIVRLRATSPNIMLSNGTVTTVTNIMIEDVEELTRCVQITGFLGQGGFASVYRGVYQASEVAVKLAMAARNTDPDQYCREAALAQQLRHPHVVATYMARGAKVTPELLERFNNAAPPPHHYGLSMPGGDAAAAAGAQQQQQQQQHAGVHGSISGRPGAYTSRGSTGTGLVNLPNFSSTQSEDAMGDPRVGMSHPRQLQQAAAVGWGQALFKLGALPDHTLMVIVQELCENGSLSQALKTGVFRPVPGRVSLLTARRMLVRTASEICRGMLHLHTANIMHGDLKPANVLLARSRKDRRGFVAKIADFGLSKLLRDDTGNVQTDSLGTVAYSSPETINGIRAKSCDVWAFGVMLWEMVAEKRPYHWLVPAQIMVGVAFDGLRPTWPREVWPELCAIGERCLATDPAARPGFAELEEELVALEEELREQSRQESFDRRVAAAKASIAPAAAAVPAANSAAPSAAAVAAAAVPPP